MQISLGLRAISLDSSFTLAYAGMADANFNLAAWIYYFEGKYTEAINACSIAKIRR